MFEGQVERSWHSVSTLNWLRSEPESSSSKDLGLKEFVAHFPFSISLDTKRYAHPPNGGACAETLSDQGSRSDALQPHRHLQDRGGCSGGSRAALISGSLIGRKKWCSQDPNPGGLLKGSPVVGFEGRSHGHQPFLGRH